jgi:hypothetical protein
MKNNCMVFAFAIVMSLFLGISPAAAQEPWMSEHGLSTQSASGGASVQSESTVVSNPVVTNPSFSTIPAPAPAAPGAPPAAPPALAGSTEVGFQTLYSTHMQVYSIPLSYAFTENIKAELSIPYVRKQLKGEYTGADLTASGLGDISVGGKYRFGDINKYQGITSFYLKLPTGQNKQFEDRQERLALGTGSYDFIINQSVAGFFGNFLVTATVGYTITTTGDYTETNDWGANVQYENKPGSVFNYMVGTEYYTPVRKLVAYANLGGVVMGRSHIKETYADWPFFNRDEDKKDALKTLDLIVGVKYMLTEKTGFRLGLIAPVLTGYDSDTMYTQSRDWAFDFGFSGRF